MPKHQSKIEKLIAELCPEGVEFKELGQCIAKNIGGGTPSKAVQSYWNGDIPWASVGDLSIEGITINSTRNFITDEDHIKNRELLIDINKAIDASVELRNKKDLINQFIASLDIHSVVDEDWQKYVEKKKIEELDEIIKQENLDHDETYKFVRNAFRNGSIATTGTALAKVLPPVSRFSPGGERFGQIDTLF
ncbi:MAG: hypothetical protein M0P74_12620 [Syntrophales bacterium]|jgi:type I restriction enzyme R subunit|nr:hypothetical protein [Syntrophales bacterium]